MHKHSFGPDVAHLEIHGNSVLNATLVDGLVVESAETRSGVDVDVVVKRGTKIKNPVYLCFGMLENGLQHIRMNVHFEEDAQAHFISHCTFSNASEVEHLMDAHIQLDAGAQYTYFERHIHSNEKGITVIPKAKIFLGENSYFKSEFELIKGRVGTMDIDYEAECGDNSVLELLSRISGRDDDLIKIREAGWLKGINSRGLLASNIAVRNNARAEIYNELTATAAGAKGHVDCNEIIQDEAQAKAIPIVDCRHPKAHITHEAAIGSVDSKQLQTLMSRGLNEEDAVEMIIQGLLRK